MNYRNVILRADLPDTAATEIMYEIAASRADGVDLIRLNIETPIDANECKRMISSVVRLMKNMKQKGSIHFFATELDFKIGSTEAHFLSNKYPTLFSDIPMNEDNSFFVYIKI